jgi:hypothetical protein
VTSRPQRDRRAEGAAWALTFLVTLSSLAFAIGAVLGWTLDLWPATPATLAVAAVAVLGGPALAAALTLAIRRGAPPRPAAAAPARPAAAVAARPAPPPPGPAPVTLSPKAARARELLDWRDSPRRRTRS